jgi:hypothetical protein
MGSAYFAAIALVFALLSNHVVADDEKTQHPTWAELTADQQKVLNPLASEWDTLRPWQRERMLEIARDYPKMDADRQQRVQERLTRWSRMTPYERENARKKHEKFRDLPEAQKQELRKKWREYQSLPEAKREQLRKQDPEVYGNEDPGN